MSWADSRTERAKSAFFRLLDNGDTANIVVAGEPTVVKRQGMRGGEVTRFHVPVIVGGEVKTWDMSGKTLDQLAAFEGGGLGLCFTVKRVGGKGDTNTVYVLKEKKLSLEDRERLAASGLLAKATIPPGGTPDEEEDDALPF